MTRSGKFNCLLAALLAVVWGLPAQPVFPQAPASQLKPFPPELSRLPLAAAPSFELKGESAEARAAELLVWFREKYKDRLHEDTYIVNAFLRHLADSIVLDAKGRQRIHPEVWDDAFTAYNNCIAAFADIKACAAPDSFKDYLARYCVDTIVTRNAELDLDGFKERLARIPAGSTVLQPVQDQVVADSVARVDTEFKSRPPPARKIVFDSLCDLNPNLRPEGYYITREQIREPLDHVAIPVGAGVVQVFRYRILNRADPLLIPPQAVLQEMAQGRLADLRDFGAFDSELLKGLNPEELDLSRAKVRDLSPLQALTALKRLRLRGCDIGDLSALKGMKLELLDISHSSVRDLTPLAGMPLKELNASETLVADLSPLTGMPLRRLDLRNSLVEKLTPLRGTQLEEIALSRRPFEDAQVLRSMESLKKISDYTPSEWFECSGKEEWFEPGPVVADAMRGGARLKLTFTSSKGAYPCDTTTLSLEFDKDGRLVRSMATQPPDLNIVHLFRPTRLSISSNELRCEAVVTISGAVKKQDYEYKLQGRIGDSSLGGSFHMRYEEEIFNPDRGYSVRVTEVDGVTTGAVARGESKERSTDPLAAGRDWPGWRGPNGNGTASPDDHRMVDVLAKSKLAWISQRDIPASRAADLRKAEKKNKSLISGGYSGPIVYNGCVYLYYYEPSGEAFDEKIVRAQLPLNGFGREKWLVDADDVLACLDGATGRVVWERTFSRKGLNLNAYNIGDPQPLLTPCAADGRIYAMGTGGRVYAVDAKSGDTVWESHLGFRRDALEELRSASARKKRVARFRRDFGTSPAVADGVLVCCDHSEYFGGQRTRQSGLLGLDTRTGSRLWHIPDACAMTASPMRWARGDREFILAASDSIVCIEPRTGKVLWKLPGASYPAAPALTADMLVCNGPKDEGLCGYRIGPGGAEKVWSAGPKYSLSACPPTVVSNRVYALCAAGLISVDIASGKVLATAQAEHVPSGLVGYHGKVIIEGMNLAGQTNEKGVEIASRWSPPYASGTTPAIADGRLFFRGPTALLCYDLRFSQTDMGDLEELREMLWSANRGVQHTAIKALCTERGEAGRKLVDDMLRGFQKEGKVDKFTHVLNNAKRREILGSTREILTPILIETLKKGDRVFTPVAISEVLGMDAAGKAEAEPILFDLLAKTEFAAHWETIWLALISMEHKPDRMLKIVGALAPSLGSKDGSARRMAMLIMESAWPNTHSKPLDEMVAKGLFECWKQEGYAYPDPVHLLSKMGPRAAVIEPELRKLFYNKDAGKTAARLLTVICPGKPLNIGPKTGAGIEEE